MQKKPAFFFNLQNIFFYFLLFCANPPHTSTHTLNLRKYFFAQLRQLRENSRRSGTLRFEKSLFCASYKGFPAAGYSWAPWTRNSREQFPTLTLSTFCKASRNSFVAPIRRRRTSPWSLNVIPLRSTKPDSGRLFILTAAAMILPYG